MRNIAGYIGRTALRRVVYVLVGALLYAVMGWFAPAKAQSSIDYSQCNNNSQGEVGVSNPPYCQTAAKADLAAKNAAHARFDAYGGSTGWSITMDESYGRRCDRFIGSIPACEVQWHLRTTGLSWFYVRMYPRDPPPPDCPLSDPPLSSGWVLGDTARDLSAPTSVCVEGCAFDQPENKTSITQRKVDGQVWSSIAGWTAGGRACTSEAPPSDDPPTDTDNDGHSDGNDNAPNNPGKNGSGDEDGDGGTSAGGGGDCNSPPSVTGNAAVAMVAYQTWATRCAIENAKAGDGSLKTTETGGGAGGAGGAGGGTGGTGDSNDPGAAGAGVGTIYTKTEQTLASVFTGFKGRIVQTELITTASGVFGGCSGGGSCPQASWTASQWGIAHDLSALCGGDLGALLAFAGYVCLAGMAFFAWKVAIL